MSGANEPAPNILGTKIRLDSHCHSLNLLLLQQVAQHFPEDVMNDRKSASQPGLLLGGALTAWVIACFVTHGPVILAYVGFQAATAGIFAWQMIRIEKAIPKHNVAASSKNETVSRAA